MTTTSRQNNLLLNQDWKRIYQTFKNADFKSYDFENLRRVMINYLRENYPEDFNDYIESSEYMALIDAVAFVGQSLAFRIDLASRENFIELAETKESVLRLARMLSYSPRRNICASGLLKFDTISTSENLIDSSGRNLSGQVIIWNDPTNSSWYEQFILVLNSAMSDNTEFGRSQGDAVIQGIDAEQYRFRSSFSDLPLFNFEKTVANRRFSFELVSTSFSGAEDFYEEAPVPGRELGFIYRQDGRGPSSANTGFYLLVKQGSLELTDFTIETPSSNEIVSVDIENINDSDVWLYSQTSSGSQDVEWTKVPALSGNNIVYNDIESNIRNIFNVVTKDKDRIDLVFADGIYGNLPRGNFRTYYRVSNGLSYSVSPTEMRGITISVPYINKQGVAYELTISLGLKSTISNASKSEEIDSIRSRAPALYYTQNRMVTGEDYNLAPLSSSQDIIKVKAINRTSSGVSRNFDIIDVSGKYSSINVFASDGYIYRQFTEQDILFKYRNRLEIINFIRTTIESQIASDDVYNFYLTKFEKLSLTELNVKWTAITTDVNQTTGCFIDQFASFLKVGQYTNNTLKYVFSDSLIKFNAPAGFSFRLGKIVPTNDTDPIQTASIWTKIIKVSGDGTNAGRGALTTGAGPVIISDVVPTGAIATQIIPKFVTNLPVPLEFEIANMMLTGVSFGIRYDSLLASWKIITPPNLNITSFFNLGTAGDISNSNLDASWFISFIKQPDRYLIRVRKMEYIFGSLDQNKFYFDDNQKTYDSNTGKTIKDRISVLETNTDAGLIFPLRTIIPFEISNAIQFYDGYQSTDRVKIAFSDSDDDGVIDNPEAFDQLVGVGPTLPYLFFKKTQIADNSLSLAYIDNTNFSTIVVFRSIQLVSIADFQHGQLVYFSNESENLIMKTNRLTSSFEIQSDYVAVVGRAGLRFQYVHNANVDRRIDPSSSNIIDLYLLTRTYDTEFRNYLAGAGLTKPIPPTSDSLRISYGANLNLIKTISDEIIYYPVNYKVLFGGEALPPLQAVFKVVKNSAKLINDNDLKVRIISAINSFFDVSNWDFGDRFFVGELITYVTNETSPDISNLVIVPTQPNQQFGSLFEIQSNPDELFISGATVDTIDIVTAISATEIRVPIESIVNTTN